jgi:hypothetical protein
LSATQSGALCRRPKGYSFSVLKRAQALGDYQTLDAHGRRVVRIHVTGADAAGSLEKLFAAAL